MKRYAAVFMTALMVAGLVPAAANGAHVEGHAEAEARLQADAGIGPDSVFYGLDRAFERVRVMTATNPNARARAHLNIAEERLAEVDAMAEANNSEAAEEARKHYENSVAEVRASAEEADADVQADVNARLQVHTEVLQGLLAKFEAEGIAGAAGIRTALDASQTAQVAVGGGSGEESGGNATAEGEAGAEAETSGGSANASVEGSATVG